MKFEAERVPFFAPPPPRKIKWWNIIDYILKNSRKQTVYVYIHPYFDTSTMKGVYWNIIICQEVLIWTMQDLELSKTICNIVGR